MNDAEMKLYLIGVFDGEGCICPSLRRDGYIGLFVSVKMASEEVIDLFIATWGGSKSKRIGAKSGYQDLYGWTLTGTTTGTFLEYAAEHSIVKKAQAQLGLQLVEFLTHYRAHDPLVNRRLGQRCISEAEAGTRRNIAMSIKALNGARSRFGVS